jgi:DNA-binding transcriptional MerR regulator
MQTEQRVYAITETARILNLSTEWLRQGERRGSLPKAKRDRNGHRYYTDEDIARLRNRRLLRAGE